MDIEFLVLMRQSNKCGSVRNDEIFNLHLGSGVGPWVSIPCLTQDTSHIYWFHSPKQLTRKLRIEIQFQSNRIVLPWPTYKEPMAKRGRLGTPALREVVTRSTCWNKEERPQKKTSCIIQPGLTYGSQHLEG